MVGLGEDVEDDAGDDADAGDGDESDEAQGEPADGRAATSLGDDVVLLAGDWVGGGGAWRGEAVDCGGDLESGGVFGEDGSDDEDACDK